MSRKNARIVAYQLVFEYGFLQEKTDLDNNSLFDKDLSIDDKEYIKTIYEGVIDHYDELKELISSNLKGYTIGRVYKSDLAALLVATYEIKYIEDIPTAVSVNEALEIVKDFSEEKSAKFVNGVLAGIVSSI